MEYDKTSSSSSSSSSSCLVFDNQTLDHEQMPVTWAKEWHMLLFKKKFGEILYDRSKRLITKERQEFIKLSQITWVVVAQMHLERTRNPADAGMADRTAQVVKLTRQKIVIPSGIGLAAVLAVGKLCLSL